MWMGQRYIVGYGMHSTNAKLSEDDSSVAGNDDGEMGIKTLAREVGHQETQEWGGVSG